MTRRWCLILSLYLLLMNAFVGGMLVARRQVLQNLGSPEAIAQWREWKVATEKSATEPGPVKRRPVKAEEPPTLILFRDQFKTITVSLGIVVSLLYFFGAIVISGTLSTRQQR